MLQESETSNVVSAIIYSKEDKSFLLLNDSSTNELSFPSTKVLEKHNDSWNKALKGILKEFQKPSPNDPTPRLFKIIKFWQPKPLAPALNIIFFIQIDLDLKKKYVKKNNMIWIFSEDAQAKSWKDRVKSPEIIYFINTVTGKPVIPSANRSCVISLSDVSWNKLTSNDALFEIDESDILVDTERIPDDSPVEHIIHAAGLTKKEQMLLYKEFLTFTFPSIFMSKNVFENFLSQFNWITENTTNIFRTADVSDRNGLSFRNFLHIICVYEANATGLAAEVRSRYIFRYFVKGSNGKMEYSEFLKLVESLLICKEEPINNATVKSEADKIMRGIGLHPGEHIPLAIFLKAVGGLKIRGTSYLLRFTKSILQAIKDKHMTTPTKRVLQGQASKPLIPAGLGDQGIQIKSQVSYDIAPHSVKLKKVLLGLCDVTTLWMLDDAFSRSSTKVMQELQHLKSEIYERFNKSYLPNDILKALDYFVTETFDSNNKKKKDAFSWGKVVPAGLGNAIINLCEKVIEIMKEEPRLLDIHSPVYVLGDLHGSFSDLKYFENILWSMGAMLSPANILLLGDYVDRGPHGVELMTHLLCMKLLSPNQIWMLRGNHEIREIQTRFTFFQECKTKFGEKMGNQIWHSFNSVFDVLPLAATIDGQVFCSHGGIPPPWLCVVAEGINSIPCPLRRPDENHLAWELMWNDPVRSSDLNQELNLELTANEGFAVNFRRGTAHIFNSYALEKFLLANSFSKVIRAHEVEKNGFQLQKQAPVTTSHKILKLLKVWQPCPLLPLYHVVYKTEISLELKKQITLKRNMSWVTTEDLASPQIGDNLKSPEITHFIYFVNDKPVPFSLKPSPIINFPEGPWDYVMSGDVIFEVQEKHIVSESAKKDGIPVENIVDAAGITKQEQAALYREFLLHTFPCMYMSRKAFENFFSQFNGITENVGNLFRTADIYSRNALSFKDFLHIIAACESDSTGLAAEIRSRYLYRYFVKNASGTMNYHEFLKLTEALLKARKAPLGEAQVKSEAEKVIKSIGLEVGAQISIIAFLKGVGGLKIRGTSSLMRFANSVTDAVKCKHSHKKSRKAEVETSDRKGGSGKGIYEKNERNFTSEIPYDLAIHCVKLNNEKLVVDDIEAFWAVKGTVSQSSTNMIGNLQKLKQNDFNLYSSSFLPNDILKALDYFVVDNKDAGKKKEAFSWGKLDPIGFAKALIKLCDMAQESFKQEPRMLEIGSPVYVIGDLFGNFSYFKKFENILWGLGPTFTPCSLLFLGNYVDQGPHGIELVAYLLSHKLRCPQQVWLIRGNHEIRDVQKKSTFFKECETKFGADLGNQLWQAINSVFDTLPLAAIIDDQLFCCHGGIPPKWLCSTVNAINKIPCPLQEPEGNKLAWELMWNDPIRLADINEDRSTELSANEGFAINFRRGTAHLFDSTALEKFLFVNAFTKVIRAHEFCKSGYQIQHKGKLVTICSSLRQGGNTNEGAVALCFNQKIRFFCYE